MNTVRDRTLDLSRGKVATIAGIGYLVILVFSLGNLVLQDLIVAGDALTSVGNIAASETAFRGGIASWLMVIAADAVVAWALYLFLEPVSRAYSLLTAWFRLVFVVIVAVVLVDLLSVASVVSSGADQGLAALSLASYEFGFNVAFVFFGLHILGLAVLIFRSDRIPTVLGVLLGIAGMGYLIDSVTSVVSSGYAENQIFFVVLVAVPALIGEYSLAIWLLVKGRRVDSAARLRPS